MRDYYIGIDNGVTGAFAILDTKNNTSIFFSTPCKLIQNYTIKKQNVNRLKFKEILDKLEPYKENAFALIERPMVNSTRFKSSMSAVRALESTLNILDMLEIPYEYIDSKKWQKVFLPEGSKGDKLKEHSRDISIEKYPEHEKAIKKQKDGDALFIAEYLKMKEY